MSETGLGGEALIALGSNLGDRVGFLDLALEQLTRHGCQIQALTPRWNTAPVDSPPQPDFLNQLALVSCRRSPAGWLALIGQVEAAGDRRRGLPHGARTLDLDLILLRSSQVDTPQLRVPHPALLQRPYLLLGAAQLAPNWKVPPPHGRTVAELAAELLRGPWRRDRRGD